MDSELPKRHGDLPLRELEGTASRFLPRVTVTVAVSRTSDELRLAKLPGCWVDAMAAVGSESLGWAGSESVDKLGRLPFWL
jgi:hypothetical protein